MSRPIASLINDLNGAVARDDTASIWEGAGTRELDQSLAVIAEHYIQQADDREELRREAHRLSSTWPLVLFVRRVSLLLGSNDGTEWLHRGLAIASLVDANCDDRDLIVSLVLLRDAGDRAGLPTTEAFNAALTWSTERMSGIIRNARDHGESATRSTVAAFGPSTP